MALPRAVLDLVQVSRRGPSGLRRQEGLHGLVEGLAAGPARGGRGLGQDGHLRLDHVALVQ